MSMKCVHFYLLILIFELELSKVANFMLLVFFREPNLLSPGTALANKINTF